MHAKNYDIHTDYYQPDQGNYCPTAVDFPRFTSFGFGEYLVVGVGDTPKSKQISEFRVYDTEFQVIRSTFNRLSHSILKGTMMKYQCHPTKIGIFYFTMHLDSTYTIFEIDLLHNNCQEHCSFTGDFISFILISED